jgi:hypothetical protein
MRLGLYKREIGGCDIHTQRKRERKIGKLDRDKGSVKYRLREREKWRERGKVDRDRGL